MGLEKSLSQIPIQELEKGNWYLGRGRCSNIGYWDGSYFLTLDFKFNQPTVKFEAYFTEKQGSFQPFQKINQGEISEAFGSKGWDKNYGKKLVIREE